VVLVWLVAMLIALMVALWPTESRCSIDAVRLDVVVHGAIEEHAPRLGATTILRGGALIQSGVQQVESIQRPRARPVRRTARGPPAVHRRGA
jgi:hypothetical protein